MANLYVGILENLLPVENSEISNNQIFTSAMLDNNAVHSQSFATNIDELNLLGESGESGENGKNEECEEARTRKSSKNDICAFRIDELNL